MAIYGLTGRRLPIHPHPLPDELLTHWFCRVAEANGLKAQTLADIAFGKGNGFWSRDPDRRPSPLAISRLSELTGREECEIQALTLAAYEGIHCVGSNATRIASWILPVGIYHRTRRHFGMQFCPICLSEDGIPYFRRQWRLAFCTFCDKHGVMLHDRCPECGVPIFWLRNDVGHRHDFPEGTSIRCWQCGFDLRRAPAVSPSAIDGASIMALRSLVALHGLGWWFTDGQSLPYSHLYFEVLRHLVGWLPGKYGSKLSAYIPINCMFGAYSKAPAFEFRSVDERHRLLVTAHWLLQAWPTRFIELAQRAGLTQAYVLRGQQLPYWFESEVRQSLAGGFYCPSPDEAADAASFLKRRGEPVTAAAIGRLLGASDSKLLSAFAIRRRESLSDDEFRRVLVRIESEMRNCRRGSLKRYVLWRDRSMFIVARLCNKTPLQVRAMMVSDGIQMAAQTSVSGQGRRRLVAAVSPYLRLVRPRLAPVAGDGFLFPSSSKGKQLSREGWRVRWLRVTEILLQQDKVSS